jgi:hypothetical protein
LVWNLLYKFTFDDRLNLPNAFLKVDVLIKKGHHDHAEEENLNHIEEEKLC